MTTSAMNLSDRKDWDVLVEKDSDQFDCSCELCCQLSCSQTQSFEAYGLEKGLWKHGARQPPNYSLMIASSSDSQSSVWKE